MSPDMYQRSRPDLKAQPGLLLLRPKKVEHLPAPVDRNKTISRLGDFAKLGIAT